MAELDAILFDAGGVLLLPDPAVTGELVGRFGGRATEPVQIRAHFAAAHAMDHARSEGIEADWLSYHRAFVASTLVPPDRLDAAAAAFTSGFGHWMWRHPVAGARRTLAELAGRGVPIGIVSNAAGQVQGELSRQRICRAPDDGDAHPDGVPVACVVDSHVVGVAKPDPRIFTGALAALGLPASERIGYMGDTVFYDVRAARAAGLRPLLHDPFGFHAADPHPGGPADTIVALEQLLDLV